MWPKDSKKTSKRGPKGLASPDREQSTITTKNKQNQESFNQNRKPSNFAWSLFQGCLLSLIFIGIILYIFFNLFGPIYKLGSPLRSTKSYSFWTDLESHDIQKYMDENYQFDWTIKQIKHLKIQKTTLKDVLKEHGKATEASSYDEDNSTIYLDYETNNNDWQENVYLTFKKNGFGSYRLTAIDGGLRADDIAVVEEENPNIGWSNDQFNQLHEGGL